MCIQFNNIELHKEAYNIKDSIIRQLGLMSMQFARIDHFLSCIYTVSEEISYGPAIECVGDASDELSETKRIWYDLINDIDSMEIMLFNILNNTERKLNNE